MSDSDKRLLGAMLDGLTNLGSVDCDLDQDVCDQLRGDHDTAQILFFPGEYLSLIGRLKLIIFSDWFSWSPGAIKECNSGVIHS